MHWMNTFVTALIFVRSCSIYHYVPYSGSWLVLILVCLRYVIVVGSVWRWCQVCALLIFFNVLRMSKDIRNLVGGVLCMLSVLCVMYLSISLLIVWQKSYTIFVVNCVVIWWEKFSENLGFVFNYSVCESSSQPPLQPQLVLICFSGGVFMKTKEEANIN